MKTIHKDIFRGVLGCLVLAVMIFILVMAAMKLGSISVTYKEIFEGLFVSYDKDANIYYRSNAFGNSRNHYHDLLLH